MTERSQSTSRSHGTRSARLQEIMRSNSTMRSRIAQSRLKQRRGEAERKVSREFAQTKSSSSDKKSVIDLSRSPLGQGTVPSNPKRSSSSNHIRTESYGDAKPGPSLSQITATTPSTVNTSAGHNSSMESSSPPTRRQVKDLRGAFADAAKNIPFDEMHLISQNRSDVPFDESNSPLRAAPSTPPKDVALDHFDTPRTTNNNKAFDESFEQHGVDIESPPRLSGSPPPAFEDYFLPDQELQYVVDKKNGNGEIIGVVRPEDVRDTSGVSADNELSFFEGRSEVFGGEEESEEEEYDDDSHVSEYRRRKLARKRRQQERDMSFLSAGTSYDEESDSDWSGYSSRIERMNPRSGAASPLEMLTSLVQTVTSLAPGTQKKKQSTTTEGDEAEEKKTDDDQNKDFMTQVRDQCCYV